MNACGESYIGNNVLSCHVKTAQIVNGKTAIPHSWPSIAKIVMKMENGSTGHCGGTLIDKKNIYISRSLKYNMGFHNPC